MAKGDLSTESGVLAFCESKKAEMVRCFERIGRFEENGQSFCGYLFATHEVIPPRTLKNMHDWKTGPKLPHVDYLPCRLPKAAYIAALPVNVQKNLFAKTIEGLGKLSKAIGYLLMTEMWHAMADSLEERQKWPESLEHAPNRGEALMLSVEHVATGRKAWKSEILRNPTRLLGWQEMPFIDAQGRFIDLTDWRS